MNLSKMLSMLNDNADDVVDTSSAVRWLNAGKDRMATEVKAIFPDIEITSDLSDTFVFDSKYHEIPVLYASAMFKGADGEEGPKSTYMSQFELGLRNFAENYSPPPQYKDDEYTQQFTATADQTDFTITKNGYNYRYGRLRVYINNIETDEFTINCDNTFTLDTGATADDKVTAIWEQHSAFEYPPMPHWRW